MKTFSATVLLVIWFMVFCSWTSRVHAFVIESPMVGRAGASSSARIDDSLFLSWHLGDEIVIQGLPDASLTLNSLTLYLGSERFHADRFTVAGPGIGPGGSVRVCLGGQWNSLVAAGPNDTAVGAQCTNVNPTSSTPGPITFTPNLGPLLPQDGVLDIAVSVFAEIPAGSGDGVRAFYGSSDAPRIVDTFSFADSDGQRDFQVFNFAMFAYSADFQRVPEPTTFLLLLAASACLWLLKKRP